MTMQQRHDDSALIDPEFLEDMDGQTVPVRARTERDLHQTCVEEDRVRAQERERIATRLRQRKLAMEPGMLATLIEAGTL
jgi:hypothetical protein